MDHVEMFGAERWLEIAEVRTYEIPKIELQLNEAVEILPHTQAAGASITDIILEAAHDLQIAQTFASEIFTAELAALEPDSIPADIEEAPPEPRTARVISINQLRQKLGIEDAAPPVRTAAPTTGRPRIIRRREMELAAG